MNSSSSSLEQQLQDAYQVHTHSRQGLKSNSQQLLARAMLLARLVAAVVVVV